VFEWVGVVGLFIYEGEWYSALVVLWICIVWWIEFGLFAFIVEFDIVMQCSIVVGQKCLNKYGWEAGEIWYQATDITFQQRFS
jgi:hypothetical protein